jgi:predicted Zn-dependent protease
MRLFVLIWLSATAWGQSASPRQFQFTQVDEKLLEEVQIVDQQLEKKGLVFNDVALESHLEEVAKPFVAVAGTPERVRWKFRVLSDPSVNAFAMPNGSVYVHTGLLALLENDAQLAGVLAHEITHVTNRHTYENYRSYRKKMVALHVMAAIEAFSPTNTGWGAAVNIVAKAAGTGLVVSIFGYSRELEREADTFAVERMAQTGYDPAEVPRTFKLLDEKLEVEPAITFYRDHPKLEDRIAYTTAMAKAKTVYAPPPPSGQEYLTITERAAQYNVQADIDSRRFRTAVARAQKLVNFRPEEPRNQFLLAEAYRALGSRTTQPTDAELTSRGKSEARKLLVKHTVEEEEKELLARPEGPKVRQANQEKAEDLYKRLESADPSYAAAYRGMGLLYEDQGKPELAVAAYRKYLEMAKDAPDALRIQRRVDALAARRP